MKFSSATATARAPTTCSSRASTAWCSNGWRPPAANCPRIQLIGENRWRIGTRTNHARLMLPTGLARIAGYADGVGLWLGHIVYGIDATGGPRLSSLVQRARRHDLAVHVYTLRQDDLPPGVADFDALLELVYDTLGADGAFTDFPDLARAFLDR
ncbi:MAG: glycerophosphodiester phosphodiesterase family protein [Gammaproteobacteria bacterium]|nr:glycerophosphodiester phosphodiesterase family protein [Gammaproteobacteria bacterium]